MFLKVVLLAAIAASSADAFPGRPAAGGPKIVGGHDAEKGECPYQVSMQHSLIGTTKDHVCGGSIIGEQWILTAGRCVTETPKLGTYYVDAGDYDLHEEDGTEQVIKVSKRITHPDYGCCGPNSSDIALLKLLSPLKFTEFIQPIKLPEPNSIPSGEVTLSGWGSSGLDPQPPSILQTVDLPLIDYDTCLEDWGASSPLRDTNVCTGPADGAVSPCHGDSGGPLVQKNADGSRTLVGIVSWGHVPCSSPPNHPAVYTRVSAFLDFIRSTMANN